MEVFQWFALIFKLFDRKVRLRLQGYRPEVICLVLDVRTRSRILLTAPPAKPSAWMPPQEGIDPDETIEQAAIRGLNAELGFAANTLHFRRSAWISKRVLPKARWGERDLPYSLRKLFGKDAMIGKGYYAALIMADAEVTITPNPAEVHDYAWVSFDDLDARIQTNSPEKIVLLQTALKKLNIRQY